MDRINRLLKTLSAIKWNMAFLIKYCCNAAFRNAIANNKSLKNICSGKTCIIVGNGPSLLNMDLTNISDFFVFTVNDIGKNQSLFKTLHSSCHVIVDPFFCELKEDDLRKFLRAISCDNKKRICICSDTLIGNPVLKEFSTIDFFFVYIHNNWDSLLRKRIDFQWNLYQTNNVVQAAIYAAIYMGFSEIKLIGCEMTSMYEHLEVNANNVINNYHSYEYTQEEKDRLKHWSTIFDNEAILKEYYENFHIFKQIRRYTEEKGIKIKNATIGGLLDMFKRESLFVKGN